MEIAIGDILIELDIVIDTFYIHENVGRMIEIVSEIGLEWLCNKQAIWAVRVLISFHQYISTCRFLLSQSIQTLLQITTPS